MTSLEGSCLCGAVRFEVTEPFAAFGHCHCWSCKHLAGGVGTTNGRSRTDAISVVAGEELLRTYQPDDGSSKTFCSACGSNLFGGGWPESEWTSVRLASFGEAFDADPLFHMFTASVARWETLPDDGLPRHDARPT